MFAWQGVFIYSSLYDLPNLTTQPRVLSLSSYFLSTPQQKAIVPLNRYITNRYTEHYNRHNAVYIPSLFIVNAVVVISSGTPRASSPINMFFVLTSSKGDFDNWSGGRTEISILVSLCSAFRRVCLGTFGSSPCMILSTCFSGPFVFRFGLEPIEWLLIGEKDGSIDSSGASALLVEGETETTEWDLTDRTLAAELFEDVVRTPSNPEEILSWCLMGLLVPFGQGFLTSTAVTEEESLAFSLSFPCFRLFKSQTSIPKIYRNNVKIVLG